MIELQQANFVDAGSGQEDYYLNHLVAVNYTNDVFSIADIFNTHGVLLVRKGMRISHDVAQKLAQHTLIKPLEQQVELDKTINGTVLLNRFGRLLENNPDMSQIHAGAGFQEQFTELLNNPNYDSILMQKLTVLQERTPLELDKGLFCAWLASLLTVEMGLTADLVNAAFLAGLAHDVGLLHIAPNIINKSGDLTAAEWRALQSHVVLGQLLLKNMKGVNQRAALAVLEHHERCDGTGYPSGKSEENLDVIGQIVGMTDSLHAIRMTQLAKLGRNLRDTLPYLHMNATTHFIGVYNAMHALLKKSGLSPSRVNPLNNFSALVEHVLSRALQLQNAGRLLEELWELAFMSGLGPEGKKLQKVTQPALRMMRSSGLLRDELMQWLQSLHEQRGEGAAEHLIQMELMQNELYWQLKKVHRVLREFLERRVTKLNFTQSRRYKQICEHLAKILNK